MGEEELEDWDEIEEESLEALIEYDALQGLSNHIQVKELNLDVHFLIKMKESFEPREIVYYFLGSLGLERNVRSHLADLIYSFAFMKCSDNHQHPSVSTKSSPSISSSRSIQYLELLEI